MKRKSTGDARWRRSGSEDDNVNITTTLPLEKDVASGDSKKMTELLELETGERLRKSISDHVVRWTVK
jgi:hypothetical protein